MAPGGEELLSFPFGGAPGCHPPVSGLPPIEIFMPDLEEEVTNTVPSGCVVQHAQMYYNAISSAMVEMPGEKARHVLEEIRQLAQKVAQECMSARSDQTDAESQTSAPSTMLYMDMLGSGAQNQADDQMSDVSSCSLASTKEVEGQFEDGSPHPVPAAPPAPPEVPVDASHQLRRSSRRSRPLA